MNSYFKYKQIKSLISSPATLDTKSYSWGAFLFTSVSGTWTLTDFLFPPWIE